MNFADKDFEGTAIPENWIDAGVGQASTTSNPQDRKGQFGRIDRVFCSNSASFHSYKAIGEKMIDGIDIHPSDHLGLFVCMKLENK